MTPDARVIVKKLGEDESPEPAWPLAVGEHGNIAASRLSADQIGQ
jgi:hypothetical protein